MSTKRAQFRAAHKVADRMEPRLAKALRIAADKIRDRIPLAALSDAIADGHGLRAAQLVERIEIEDALQPSSMIVRDAFTKGADQALS